MSVMRCRFSGFSIFFLFSIFFAITIAIAARVVFGGINEHYAMHRQRCAALLLEASPLVPVKKLSLSLMRWLLERDCDKPFAIEVRASSEWFGRRAYRELDARPRQFPREPRLPTGIVGDQSGGTANIEMNFDKLPALFDLLQGRWVRGSKLHTYVLSKPEPGEPSEIYYPHEVYVQPRVENLLWIKRAARLAPVAAKISQQLWDMILSMKYSGNLLPVKMTGPRFSQNGVASLSLSIDQLLDLIEKRDVKSADLGQAPVSPYR